MLTLIFIGCSHPNDLPPAVWEKQAKIDRLATDESWNVPECFNCKSI